MRGSDPGRAESRTAPDSRRLAGGAYAKSRPRGKKPMHNVK